MPIPSQRPPIHNRYEASENARQIADRLMRAADSASYIGRLTHDDEAHRAFLRLALLMGYHATTFRAAQGLEAAE